MYARRSAAAVLVTLFLAACGGTSTTAQKPSGPPVTLPSLDGPQAAVTAPPTPTPAPTPNPEPGPTVGTRASVLPDLVVDDVGAGAKVNLASLVPSPQPLLVWFWAPH
ncbi:MAG: hypothetical protein ACRD1K_07295 [Acidimicrobiales bacterium]